VRDEDSRPWPKQQDGSELWRILHAFNVEAWLPGLFRRPRACPCHRPLSLHNLSPAPSSHPPGGGRSNVVAYSLPAPSEAGDEPLQNEEGHYAFQLQELRAAGTYSAVGEMGLRLMLVFVLQVWCCCAHAYAAAWDLR